MTTVIGPVRTQDEIAACFPVIHQLRPDLTEPDDPDERVLRQSGQGFHLPGRRFYFRYGMLPAALRFAKVVRCAKSCC
jgi:hypothetical protein